jgi:hypothetical protein
MQTSSYASPTITGLGVSPDLRPPASTTTAYQWIGVVAGFVVVVAVAVLVAFFAPSR